jgi:hypothetical protein
LRLLFSKIDENPVNQDIYEEDEIVPWFATFSRLISRNRGVWLDNKFGIDQVIIIIVVFQNIISIAH